MDRVRQYFDRYARKGQTRSAEQLAAFCRKNNIPYDMARLRRVRHSFKYTALAQAFHRPQKFMASSVSKYGVVHVDMANLMPEGRSANRGNAAFLCAVECLSGQLVALPCKDLTMESWKSAIKRLAETSVIHAIRIIVSDRDSAVKSSRDGGLRHYLKQTYGISWLFLKNRSKAFKSERMIRFLKTRLSTAMRANGNRVWVTLIDGVCRDYNASFIKGTTIRRKDVNQYNYLTLLEQLYRSPEPTLIFSTAEAYRYPSKLSRYLWRYKVGDRVLLARKVDYDLQGKNYFEKASVVGSFGETQYVVTSCTTKRNWQLFLCPVYTLARRSDGKALTGKFYEVELAPCDYDDGDQAGAD